MTGRKYLKSFENYIVPEFKKVSKNDIKKEVINLIDLYNVKKFDEKEFNYFYNLYNKAKGDNDKMLTLSIYSSMPDI